jgi:hypothetical protein
MPKILTAACMAATACATVDTHAVDSQCGYTFIPRLPGLIDGDVAFFRRRHEFEYDASRSRFSPATG